MVTVSLFGHLSPIAARGQNRASREHGSCSIWLQPEQHSPVQKPQLQHLDFATHDGYLCNYLPPPSPSLPSTLLRAVSRPCLSLLTRALSFQTCTEIGCASVLCGSVTVSLAHLFGEHSLLVFIFLLNRNCSSREGWGRAIAPQGSTHPPSQGFCQGQRKTKRNPP